MASPFRDQESAEHQMFKAYDAAKEAAETASELILTGTTEAQAALREFKHTLEGAADPYTAESCQQAMDYLEILFDAAAAAHETLTEVHSNLERADATSEMLWEEETHNAAQDSQNLL